MTTIELFGQVGAGKSTVARAIRRHLREAGYEPVDMKSALHRCLARTWWGRLFGRIAPAKARRRLLKAIYSRGLHPLYSLRLALTNPRLFGAVMRAQLGNGLPWWHKRRIWRLFFNQSNGLAFVSGRLDEDEILLLEEGALHRAINLFSWHKDGLRFDLVDQYLEHLPALDLVVRVDAPQESCWQRSQARGLPRRLRQKDDDTKALFFENAGRIVARISAHLAVSGRPAIVVDNGGQRGDFESALGVALRQALADLDAAAAQNVAAWRSEQTV